ncbi:RNA polymerase sigma-70 factor, ECF subfamily [Pseudarcicella hirudinis]|uniref:RNA polymerase sigma-70 factor, ECF subfamily n=1 Tax=Pseudarcicella hirudinis TaxID=1079859 RepID=A0A1I5SQB1_9BACT|nr:sigma-70 family RNA polymerase sigma factor [Pseudarcicella hirudinis]SFP72811.1 RNA polymerase sigma-70 factor, ECF subfamily [Pseudarcicella hirudinis]
MKKDTNISNPEHPYDELWTRFRTGDEVAFEEIYQTHVGILYNYGFHIVANAWLVQEAIQDLFADLWRSRHALSDTTSVKYYLFRSLRRKLHRMISAEQSYTEICEDDKSYEMPQTNSFETDHIAEENQFEQIRKLQISMAGLPARQLEVIRLRFFDEFSLEEIASIMQMNEQSVRNLIQRSIRKLRQSFVGIPITFFFLFHFFF